MAPDNPPARIPALRPEDFTAEQSALAKPGSGRESLNIVRTFVNHPSLYEKWMEFSEFIVFASSLSLREREILTLKTIAECKGAYELAQHAVVARSVGLTDAEIAAAKSDGSGLSEHERALVHAAGELTHHYAIAEATWKTLAQRYSHKQLMEVVFFVGNYTILAMATNSFGTEIEPNTHELWKPYQTQSEAGDRPTPGATWTE